MLFFYFIEDGTHIFFGGGDVPLLAKNTKLVQRTELDCGHVDRIANWRLVVPGAGVFLWQVCRCAPHLSILNSLLKS